jgi:hypothetical protein
MLLADIHQFAADMQLAYSIIKRDSPAGDICIKGMNTAVAAARGSLVNPHFIGFFDYLMDIAKTDNTISINMLEFRRTIDLYREYLLTTNQNERQIRQIRRTKD